MHATNYDTSGFTAAARYHSEIHKDFLTRISSATILFTIVGFGLLFMTAITIQPWAPVADLLRDPLAVAEMSEKCCKLYFGAVSTLGSLLWFMTGAICLFAGAVLMVLDYSNRQADFMISAGLFTGWLGADDLFMIHDHVLPEFGVPQLVTYAVYGLLALAFLALYWREIIGSRVAVFLTAGMLLAASVGIDVFIHDDHPLRIVFEDGAKLIGIALWGAFHVAAAADYLVAAVRSHGRQAQ